MFLYLLVLLSLCNQLNGYIADYDDNAIKELKAVTSEAEVDTESINFLNEKNFPVLTNIDCDSISEYASSCSNEAFKIYNYTIKTLPLPSRINDWCKSIKMFIDCATDWNNDCAKVTDSTFNDESIKGHVFIYKSICLENKYMNQYQTLTECIENTALDWEDCYYSFAKETEKQKSKSVHWTHYETHFYLCCARSSFRKCTLKAVIDVCPRLHAIAIQRYSVVISEGDVFQDCEHNMMYHNCPGGDPRPKAYLISKLVRSHSPNTGSVVLAKTNVFSLCLLLLFGEYTLF